MPRDPAIRWFQFRLRTVMLAVTLAAGGCWLVRFHLEREAVAAARVQALAQLAECGASIRREQPGRAGDDASATAQSILDIELNGGVPYDEAGEFYSRRGEVFYPALREPWAPHARAGTSGLSWLAGLPELRSFSGIEVDDAGLASLGRMANLEQLSLIFAGITDEGCRHFARLANLRRLTITDAVITGFGLRHLAPLRDLESLDLSGNPIDDDGLAHLPALPSLRRLVLRSTKITDDGLRHLAGQTSLWRLNLNETEITADGLRHLSPLAQLKRLDVRGTKVSHLRYLADLPELRVVFVENTPLSDDEEESFSRARPTVIVERNFAANYQWHQGVTRWLLKNDPNARGHGERHARGNGGLGDATARHIAMRVLVLAGTGNTRRNGPRHDVVSGDVSTLERWSNPNLRTASPASPIDGIESRAIASLALTELCRMGGDGSLVPLARQVFSTLISSWEQYDLPGRSSPDIPSPGWLMLAFQSARDAGIEVPDRALPKLRALLDRHVIADRGLYGFDGTTPNRLLTAEALLCGELSGWGRDDPRVIRARAFLSEHPPSYVQDTEYWFFGTLAIRRGADDSRDKDWFAWQESLRLASKSSWREYGRERGSVDSCAPAGKPIGRFESTCLAFAARCVYYRHLPIYEQPTHLRTEP